MYRVPVECAKSRRNLCFECKERSLGQESMGAMGTEVGTEAGREEMGHQGKREEGEDLCTDGNREGKSPLSHGDKGASKPLSTEHFVEPLISEPIPSPMDITTFVQRVYRNRDLAEEVS